MNCTKSLQKWNIGLGVMLAMGLPLGAAAMQWPDTGQKTCYNNDNPIPCPTEKTADFHGQDAQIQGPTRSYTKLGADGVELNDDAADWIMVRDNVTGLVWEVKENNDGVEDYNNPHDADNQYYFCDSKQVHPGTCGESYNNTEDFIAALNNATFGGYSDWRMPSIKELSTLLYMSTASPLVNWDYFPKTQKSYYFSYTLNANANNYWCLSFHSSMLDGSHSKHYVRAVRGGL